MLEHVEKFYYGLNISSYQYHKCNYRNNNTYILVAQTVKNLPAMQETQVCSLGQEDPLEKEMATHSSILACEILWTEEPGGLWSMGSQKSRMQLSKQQQPCLQDWLHNFWALRKMQTQSPLPQDY